MTVLAIPLDIDHYSGSTFRRLATSVIFFAGVQCTSQQDVRIVTAPRRLCVIPALLAVFVRSKGLAAVVARLFARSVSGSVRTSEGSKITHVNRGKSTVSQWLLTYSVR